MSGELNEISLAIGELKAQHHESVRQREAMFRKLDQIADTVTQQSGITKAILDDHAEIKAAVVEHGKHIDDFKTLKNKGLGVLAFVGLLSSGLVNGVIEFFKAVGRTQ